MATSLVPRSTSDREVQTLAPPGAPDYVAPGLAAAILWRRKFLILFVAVLVSIPLIAFVARLQRYYDAEATLTIGVHKTSFSDLQVSSGEVVGDTLTLRTQTDILNSDNMAGRVVDKMNLVATPLVHEAITAGPGLMGELMALVHAPSDAPVGPQRSLQDRERQAAIGWLKKHVTVTNDGHSYTLVIRARTEDAELSAAIANGYAAQYLDFNRQLKVQAIARGRSLLDQQIAPLEARVQAAEQAAEKFREANGLNTQQSGAGAAAGQGGTIADQQLAQINQELVAARADLALKQATLQQAQNAIKRGVPAEIPRVANSPLIQSLRNRAADLSANAAALSQSAGGANPALRTAQAASSQLKIAIDHEVASTVATLSSEVASAELNVASLTAQLASTRSEVTDQAKARVSLRQLDSAAAAAQVVYRDFLGRYEQASSEAALQEPDANLITTAEAPLGPSGPPRLQLMGLSVLGGIGIGCLLALAMDRSSKGMRTLEQLEVQTGLFPLGIVPVGRGKRLSQFAGGSLYTESVNSIRRILRFGNEPTRAKVVLITSAARAEGKTDFSLSMAASVASEGGRALLVDCDIYSRTEHPIQKSAKAKEARSQSTGIIVLEDALPGVDMMAFRRRPGMAAGLFDPEQLKEIVEAGRKRYDLIVLDAPPVLAVANTAMMAQVADGTIMVVHWNRTPPVAVNSAVRTLQAYGVRILGGVLTRVKANELGKTEGGYGHAIRNISGYFEV